MGYDPTKEIPEQEARLSLADAVDKCGYFDPFRKQGKAGRCEKCRLTWSEFGVLKGICPETRHE